jgi:hypothetical protein
MLDKKQIGIINDKLDHLFELFKKDLKEDDSIENIKNAINELKLNMSSIIDQRAESLILKQSSYCKILIEQIDKKLNEMSLKCEDFRKEINIQIKEIREELNTKIENHIKEVKDEERKYKQILYKSLIFIIISLIIAILDKFLGIGLVEYIKQLKLST